MKVEIDGKTYCVETLIFDNKRLREEVIASAKLHRLILDNIRAEIWDLQYGDEEKNMTDEDRADAYNNAIIQAIEIIDKYKAESEN